MMLRQHGADQHAEYRATEHAREHDRTNCDRTNCNGSHGRLDSRLYQRFDVWSRPESCRAGYSLKTSGGPLTRLPLRSTLTSTRSAILMNGMPLFIPNSLRSNAIVPVTVPSPVPLPVIVNVSVSGLETPRMVNVPGISRVLGPVCTTLVA